MNLSQCHVDFFMHGNVPAFAVRLWESKLKKHSSYNLPDPRLYRARLIDACVNAHANPVAKGRDRKNDIATLCWLVRSQIKGHARNPNIWTQTGREYLAHLARSGDTPLRRAYAARWLRRLEKEEHGR